jgi:hypothetical protein
MLRILRAFAWLRWRVLLNSLERRGSRDAIERFSMAFEQLTPILVFLLMVPSTLGLAAVGAYAGWQLALGEPRVMSFELLRFVLLGGCIFALVGPIVLPAGERTNAVRLLLLPIPRGLLYLAQAISAVADPWMLLVAAVVVAIPVGLAAGGAPGAAALIGVAGIILLVLLAGVTLVVTTVVQLVVRDRRRGEIITLFFIVLLPMIGILPGVFSEERHDRMGAGERRREPHPVWATFQRIATATVPSELYVRTTRDAAQSQVGYRSLATLAGTAIVLHGVAFVVFSRVLSSPAISGSSQSRTRWQSRLPGVSARTSAVALAQLKLGLRTPRGRSTILSPIVLFVVLAAMMFRSQSGARLGFIFLETGVGLATFACYVSLLSIVPLAMNQFAIDRAGLTLMLLAPLDTRSLLNGKAIGNALIAAIPCAICLIGAVALFPNGHPALWLCVPLALVATYILAAPVAATLSALLPRSVDMNSMGRSNAHGTAGFLGTLTFLAAGAPCLFLVLLANRILDRPILAPLFLLIWIAICAAVSIALLNPVARLFERRRENLAMTV